MITPIILSGGVGSRLWPLSRETYPKQFLRLYGNHSLFQKAIQRSSDRRMFSKPIVVCNAEHRFRVSEHLHQIDKTADIILEPMGRNTAPAIASAALLALSQNRNDPMLVLSSDHVIQDKKAFLRAVHAAAEMAEDGHLLTFGVKPNRPATDFGYIKSGKILKDGYEVADFFEKPDAKKAKKFVQQGYLWNSGIFVFSPTIFLAELESFHPQILKCVRASFDKRKHDLGFIKLDEGEFKKCPSESIDYAIMEHTKKAAVVKMDAGWNDVGNWASLWEITKSDDKGNSLFGDILAEKSKNNYLRSESKLLVALGLNDMIVVDTKDATLVTTKKYVGQVKDIVEQLKLKKRQEYHSHRKEYRPWGHYEALDFEKNFQVKRITVGPGKKLSLQMHKCRSEHWIVVKGKAKVTRGSEEFLLKEGESTFIPKNTKHRLENPGKLPLEIVEVQTGDYLGEDDIIRFDDDYGRKI